MNSNLQVLINVSSDEWPYHSSTLCFEAPLKNMHHIWLTQTPNVKSWSIKHDLSYCPSSIQKVPNGVSSNWCHFRNFIMKKLWAMTVPSLWTSIRQTGVLLLQLCQGEFALFELVGEAVLNNCVWHLKELCLALKTHPENWKLDCLLQRVLLS